jgi:hypothetical protein
MVMVMGLMVHFGCGCDCIWVWRWKGFAFRVKCKSGRYYWAEKSEDIKNVCNSGDEINLASTSIKKTEVIESEFGTYFGTVIGDCFLYNCESLTTPPSIPNSVTSTGYSFMFGCTSLTRPPAISSSVASIGGDFMFNCTSLKTLPIIPMHVRRK